MRVRSEARNGFFGLSVPEHERSSKLDFQGASSIKHLLARF